MDDDLFEPLTVNDLSSLPDIPAGDFMNFFSDSSSTDGDILAADESSQATSSPTFHRCRHLGIPTPEKTDEQWLVELLEPIIEANVAHISPGNSPPTDNKVVLFPKTFSGLIAEHALAAHMSKMSLVYNSAGDSSDVQLQGEEKGSTKNQSRRGMKYNIPCKQCREKKAKCVCPKKIDAGVTAHPKFVSFNLKTELCVVVKKEQEDASVNSTDREIKEEKQQTEIIKV